MRKISTNMGKVAVAACRDIGFLTWWNSNNGMPLVATPPYLVELEE